MADADDVVPDGTKKPDGEGTPKTYSEEAFKEVIAERDKAKKALKAREDAEKKAQEAKLLEEGKLKEAFESAQARVKELEGLEEEVKAYRKEKAEIKKALLEELPKEKRELFESASEAVLREAVELYKSSKADTTEPRKAGRTGDARKYEDYTSAELLELKSQNPALWRVIYSDWYERKHGTKPPATFLK